MTVVRITGITNSEILLLVCLYVGNNNTPGIRTVSRIPSGDKFVDGIEVSFHYLEEGTDFFEYMQNRTREEHSTDFAMELVRIYEP